MRNVTGTFSSCFTRCNGHLDRRVRRLRAAGLEVGVNGRHARGRSEELFRAEVVLVVLIVIAVRAAEVILAMLDGLSIVVEPGRSFIIIFPQGKFRSASESVGFTR